MQPSNRPATLSEYIKKYWFQISLLTLIIIACFKNELSFHIQLNSPKNDVHKTDFQPRPVESTTAIKPNADAADSGIPLDIGRILGFNKDKKNAEFPEIDEETKIAYLKRFASVAVAEKKKFGIPAALILAQALRESYAGKRDMAVNSNNHFGAPASFDWQGPKDVYDGVAYRRYENAWVSFRDHSVFITTGKFSKLKRLRSNDYKGWAKGLQSLGYPGADNHLAEELISTIEGYQLNRLDQ